MSELSLADIEFEFRNAPVKVVVIREIPFSHPAAEKLATVSVDQDVEVPFWVAEELVSGEYARFRDEDVLDMPRLSKIHWKETMPSSAQLPSLQPNFYFMLRLLLEKLKREVSQSSNKRKEYERAMGYFDDIVSCRLRKIVSFAAAPGTTADLVKSMTPEEQWLYARLKGTVAEWKDTIAKGAQKPD